ncbi:MAG TPA: carbon monoxide dehydrogenase subunit G [Gemmatimonadales bacterium]|nr:carbon monoxide dehydrogenase subunit G [Gemmatimonadales bacterium]
MRLTFSGAPEVPAPLRDVWPRILDPHFVAKHGPGVESVEVLDPYRFKVITGFGVGSIRLRFGIDVELVEVIPPTRFTMRARGKAPGSAVEITALMLLEVLEETRTRLAWQADTSISGTVASVGARLMEGTARKLTEQFWAKFAVSIADAGPYTGPENPIAERVAQAGETAAPPPPPPPPPDTPDTPPTPPAA